MEGILFYETSQERTVSKSAAPAVLPSPQEWQKQGRKERRNK